MGIVRFASAPNGRVVQLADDQRRLPASVAAMLAAEVAAMSISDRQARAIERARILAGEYAAATSDPERARIAGEIASVKRAALGTRPVSESEKPTVPMPDITHVVTIIPGMHCTGMNKRGELRWANAWERVGSTQTGPLYVRPNGMSCAPAGSTIQRRWSKHPHASQTWVYRSDSGSIHRVGNVPSALVPESLSATAAMMTHAYQPVDGESTADD